MGDDARVDARGVVVEALAFARKPDLGGDGNAKSTSGAVVGGVRVDSDTTINLTTVVHVGTGAVLNVATDPAAGDLVLRASNVIVGVDKAVYGIGGALVGAGVDINFRVETDVARVDIGPSASLTSTGDVQISARGHADIRSWRTWKPMAWGPWRRATPPSTSSRKTRCWSGRVR